MQGAEMNLRRSAAIAVLPAASAHHTLRPQRRHSCCIQAHFRQHLVRVLPQRGRRMPQHG